MGIIFGISDVPMTSAHVKEFYVFDVEPTGRTPTWMFNDSLGMDMNGWIHVPTKALHPWKMPEPVRQQYSVAFGQVGPPGPVLRHAVSEGFFLTVHQLTLLQQAIRFPMPEKGKGHGKNGRIVKRDWAESLIKHLFPDATCEEFEKMLKGICGQSWRHLSPSFASKHCADVIRAWNGMPAEDQQDYVKLAAVAKDEELLKEKRDRKEQMQRTQPNSKREHKTPDALRDLIPQVQGCRLTRHPALKRFQAFYTELDEKGSLLI